MPTFSPDALAAALNIEPDIQVDIQAGSDHRGCIALSGGLDSMVLLHALAILRAGHPKWSLRAVHIDHQLQPQSGLWAEHCRAAAQALGIPCEIRKVSVTDIDSQGLEAAARRARYEAFADLLQPGEVLLTAHHADDQLETLLIALVRGSGLSGLSGMPAKARFAAGWHQRPLLGFVRTDLSEWAERQGLAFVEDPSNRDTRFDRNFLRHEILPRLKARWPAIAATVSRSARHLAEADGLLDRWADQEMKTAVNKDCLSVARLRELDAPRRRLVLRRWIRSQGLLAPATRTLAAMEHDLLTAADDRAPCVAWPGAQVHRHRDWLYAEAAFPEIGACELSWAWGGDLSLPAELGVLRMQRGDENEAAPRIAAQRLPSTLSVHFRHGGERIRLPGEKHRRELKKLLQASHVLPWWRVRLPLIYAGDDLVAVANLWISDEFAAKPDEPGVRPHWERRHRIYSV